MGVVFAEMTENEVEEEAEEVDEDEKTKTTIPTQVQT